MLIDIGRLSMITHSWRIPEESYVLGLALSFKLSSGVAFIVGFCVDLTRGHCYQTQALCFLTLYSHLHLLISLYRQRISSEYDSFPFLIQFATLGRKDGQD